MLSVFAVVGAVMVASLGVYLLFVVMQVIWLLRIFLFLLFVVVVVLVSLSIVVGDVDMRMSRWHRRVYYCRCSCCGRSFCCCCLPLAELFDIF